MNEQECTCDCEECVKNNCEDCDCPGCDCSMKFELGYD